ncbi:MAG: Hpt domain-containing protein [Brevundimonas sp.]|uniref:Hpt domain-containing protein n=1 Tax=Brevundimonas sp. TaxID=1871086 RepID=UPI002489870C|nr:Hpt domain-containing protein [Brevundimonas sp.]MDI1326173.1 Hpt domain-containing protein [Brevundimonas sp.]
MTDPLAALRSLFVERCRDDLRELRRLRDQADTDAVCGIVHRLAGAAGSFGFPDISRAALVIDQRMRDGREISGVDVERLLALLVEVTNPPDAGSPRKANSDDVTSQD